MWRLKANRLEADLGCRINQLGHLVLKAVFDPRHSLC